MERYFDYFMIQTLSNLKIIDNSGGREAHCIKVLKKKKCATVGDVIVVSLRRITKLRQRIFKARKVIVGKIYRVFILQTKKDTYKYDGSTVKFSFNAGILLNRNDQPMGTRVKGAFPIDLRKCSHLKTMSLGPNLI